MRGNATQPSGSQWVHLTHSNTLGPAGGGTAGGSAPHADSRDLNAVIDANGVDVILFEGCDGGVYRRTKAQNNQGDWFSMNGDLQTTEFHAIAWDANSHVAIGGAQDTGTPQEPQKDAVRWQSVSTGDGGVVAVDASSNPGFSTRYSSYYNLGSFRRQVYDNMGVFQREVSPTLTVSPGGNPPTYQFYTPIRLNTVTPTRLIIGAGNSVYESLDQGDTITEVGPGIVVNGSGPNPIAYGANGNPDILYVGAGTQVWVRTAASPAALTASAYAGGEVVGIAIDPNSPQTAYVLAPDRVYQTTDAGAHWSEITGNLATLKPGRLRSIAFSTNNSTGAVMVGGDTGVFTASVTDFNHWSASGRGLPAAPVFHIEYNPTDRLFLVGTLGRGAWILTP